MANYTLTYSDVVQGFPSFYSYNPDWMIGMNNNFYTFKGGNLYKHNADVNRNTFYESWWTAIGTPLEAFKPTKLQSVFNTSPLENKLFKTINIEGDDSWGVTLQTDIQNSGFIESTWFEKKEASFYGFVRNSGTLPAELDEYALRSLNGVGPSTTVTGGTIVDFSLEINISNIMSIGDALYFLLPVPGVPGTYGTTPQYAGEIVSINSDLLNGINNIVILPSPPTTVPITVPDAFFLFIKNAVAESHGVLGHYCVFDMTNTNASEINLFAVESEIMKSFP